MKINVFRGDLTDVSAQTEALVETGNNLDLECWALTKQGMCTSIATTQQHLMECEDQTNQNAVIHQLISRDKVGK